jgi:hypothetical protein
MMVEKPRRTFDNLRHPDAPTHGETDVINAAYAKLFAYPEAAIVLADLRKRTVDFVLGPDVSDGALRMKEGERQLYRSIETRILNGRRGKQ